jgi:hypothetical protein
LKILQDIDRLMTLIEARQRYSIMMKDYSDKARKGMSMRSLQDNYKVLLKVNDSKITKDLDVKYRELHSRHRKWVQKRQV